MSQNTKNLELYYSLYSLVAVGIFVGAAMLHGLRAHYEWDLVYADWSVPIWVSWLIMIVAVIMAITAIRKMC